MHRSRHSIGTVLHLFAVVQQYPLVVLARSQRPRRGTPARVEVYGLHAGEHPFGGVAECTRMLDPFEVVDVGRDERPTAYPVEVRLAAVDQAVQEVFL